MLIRVRSRVLQLPRGLLNDYVQTLEGLALWPAAFVNHPEKGIPSEDNDVVHKGPHDVRHPVQFLLRVCPRTLMGESRCGVCCGPQEETEKLQSLPKGIVQV